jgi:hypothetical protein
MSYSGSGENTHHASSPDGELHHVPHSHRKHALKHWRTFCRPVITILQIILKAHKIKKIFNDIHLQISMEWKVTIQVK